MPDWRPWWASGQLVDVALAAIVIEAVVLVALRARTGRGMRVADVIGQLLAGAFLLAAVRSAVTGAPAEQTLLLMSASFPAHLFDLSRRARRARERDEPRG